MNTETPNDVEQDRAVLDDEEEEVKIPWYKNWKTWLKISIILLVIGAITLAIIFNKQTGKALTSFLDWMQNNPALGSFAFIGVYWFCTVFFIPGSLLTFGAGFVFRVVAGPWAGVFLATLVVIIGAALGATTAFILGRFVFRDSVAGYKKKYEKFDVIDKVVQQQGLKVTILLRLSPVIPFNVFNYAMGLTAVTFRDYNIAHIGMIPGTLAYCFIGGTLGAIGESVGFGDDPTILIVTIVGTVVAIAGMVYISWIAKKEFAKIAAQNEHGVEMDDNDIEAGKENTPSNDGDSTGTPPTGTYEGNGNEEEMKKINN